MKMIKVESDITPELSFTNLLRYQGLCAYNFKFNEKKRYASYILDVKANAYNFSKKINVNFPAVYFFGLAMMEAMDNLKFPCVFKPTHESSAKGVFICYSEKNIVYLNNGHKISSKNELKEFCEQLLTRKRFNIKKDSWMCEELILEEENIARDIKFYMFYGKIGLILETQRVPEIKRCWRNEELEFVKTGKYDDLLYEALDVPDGLVDLVTNISLKIPVPFIRIDFLVTSKGFYIGEFTPAPGGYWIVNEEWDKKLGEYYQESALRLVNDVAYGKTFPEYAEFINISEIL